MMRSMLLAVTVPWSQCYLKGVVQLYGRDRQGRRVFERRRVSVCVSEQAGNENESKQQCAAKSSTATPSL